MINRTTGVVRWFDGSKGYGYITAEHPAEDVFVHHSAITGKGLRLLRPGEKVEFSLEQSYRGPQAVEVVRV
ncbi:MAG: cold-shock protein [Anaerolineales bacterium]